MTRQFAVAILGYAVAVNVVAYAAMAFDKARAVNNLTRIPESTLLNLALLGGSIGTVVAQRRIRHKTRKEPFRSRLAAILVFQLLALVALAVAVAWAGSPEALWLLLTS
jgi:uncharacterized membrane protein YsdA (DUF1294 family)